MKLLRRITSSTLIPNIDSWLHQHYYGLGDYTDLDVSELIAARDAARQARDKFARRYASSANEYDQAQMFEYSRIFSKLGDAVKVKREKDAGIYDIKRQIERDIWNLIDLSDNMRDYDSAALKELQDKYSDHASLFNSIKRRILNRERWMYN